MKSIQKIIGSTLLCLLSASALSGGPDMETKPWSVYIGGFGSGSWQNISYSDSDLRTAAISGTGTFTSTQPFVATATAASPGGGALFGFGHTFTDNRNYLGFEADGQFNAKSNNGITRTDAGILSLLDLAPNIENKFELQYQVDLMLVYGVHVASIQDLFYVKLGPSYANLKESAKITQNIRTTATDVPFSFSGRDGVSSQKSLWGGALGFGAKHTIYKNLEFFAEYVYAYYGKQSLSNLSENFSNTAAGIATSENFTRKATASTSSLRVGLTVNFV